MLVVSNEQTHTYTQVYIIWTHTRTHKRTYRCSTYISTHVHASCMLIIYIMLNAYFYARTKDAMSSSTIEMQRNHALMVDLGKNLIAVLTALTMVWMGKQCANLDLGRIWGICRAVWYCLFPAKASENHLPLVQIQPTIWKSWAKCLNH